MIYHPSPQITQDINTQTNKQTRHHKHVGPPNIDNMLSMYLLTDLTLWTPKKIHSNLNSLNTFTKETSFNKVKLPKVGSNAIEQTNTCKQGTTTHSNIIYAIHPFRSIAFVAFLDHQKSLFIIFIIIRIVDYIKKKHEYNIKKIVSLLLACWSCILRYNL